LRIEREKRVSSENHVPSERDNEAKRAEGDARREVLKRLGVYGAVSAPILMGVLKAEKAVAQTGGGIPGGGGPLDP
jgi:hypothetical protein